MAWREDANITKLKVTTLTATNATVANLAATNALASLTATAGTITTLGSTTGTIATLNSTTGTIATLNATTGTIATLGSTTGTITTLNATTGAITNLTVSGTLTASPLAAQIVADATATRLKLGTGALEVPTSATFGFTAAAANVAEVLITVVNSAGTTMARVTPLTVWLSDASTGVGLTGTAASGTVQAKSAAGTDVGVLTEKKVLRVHTLAAGTYVLEITASGKTAYYVGVELPCGLVVISRVMTSADYGA